MRIKQYRWVWRMGVWLGVLAMVTSWGCRKDEAFIYPAGSFLSISTDTVKFDTVFTGRGSATINFKIKNISGDNIKIERILLGGGENSPYRMNVSGIAGKRIDDFELFADDSAFVFVEVTIDPTQVNAPFVQEDSILFESQGAQHKVILQAYGQNANYLSNEIIACNAVWTEGKPYVLLGSVLVEKGCRLTMQPGTKVYGHRNASLLVQGTLRVQGTVDRPVLFRGDRLEQAYKDEPGQWNGLHFLSGSSDNIIINAQISNAIVGIRVDSLSTIIGQPNLQLDKVRIRNMSAIGILGYTAQINAKNCLMHNCGQASVVGELGGSYQFTHCTISDGQGVVAKRGPIVYFNNLDYNNGQGLVIKNPIQLGFRNSIVWGGQDDELVLEDIGEGEVTFTLLNNLIKGNASLGGTNNIFNKSPEFYNTFNNNYELDSSSIAINKGQYFGAPYNVVDDLKGKPRIGNPDLGCYENQ